MIFPQQHDLGFAGLALLRNWIIGDDKTARKILEEIRKISCSNNTSVPEDSVAKFDIKSGYQAWSETYDSGSNILIDAEEPVVKSILKDIPKGRVLDAACGTGRYVAFLHSLGHVVTGVDLSLEMLEKAKARSPKINFIQGDLSSLPFTGPEFDLTICALTIAHYSDIEKILSELKRVTRQGGNIIISDIHPWIVSLGVQADFHDKDGKWGYITNCIHWHSSYTKIFNTLNLKLVMCEEPQLGEKEIKVVASGSDLSLETLRTALLGLPVALIWVLQRI